MEYFGISNSPNYLNEDFITDKNLFPFIDVDGLNNPGNNINMYNNMVNSDVPILYEHRHNPVLKHFWGNIIKDGDIVTNRAPLRALAKNEKVEKGIVEVNGVKVYLIWCETTNREAAQSGLEAEAAVFRYPTRQKYSIYRYKSYYDEGLKCTVHYTCEIDGFIRSRIGGEIIYEPVELKSFTLWPNSKFDLTKMYPNRKIDICFQCYLAGIETVLFGLKNNNLASMELQMYKTPNPAYCNSLLVVMKKNLRDLFYQIP